MILKSNAKHYTTLSLISAFIRSFSLSRKHTTRVLREEERERERRERTKERASRRRRFFVSRERERARFGARGRTPKKKKNGRKKADAR